MNSMEPRPGDGAPTMVKERTDAWQRMQSIYGAALACPPERRDAFVRAEAAGDQALATEVLALLAARAAAGDDFLEPALSAPPAVLTGIPPIASLVGRRIGRYLVGERLGEGGMAVVHAAEQFDPPKAVALKVIRRHAIGAADAPSLAREARILARLHHPGIAEVYEAGTFDLGDGPQPWVALELVRGLPLDAHADDEGLDARRRIALVIDACEAVHHAHLRGVVHRDLKPSNILVAHGDDGAARIKILDFGIAQLVDGDLQASRSLPADALAGTLPYMSPEHVSGDAGAIDARSDVYALGVIAYALVADRLPIAPAERGVLAMLRAVADDAPVPLGRVAPALRGDLELVIHTALEKDPAQRYASAADFAADLRRWLEREPIRARPATRTYRLRRFVQREPVVALALAGTILALGVGAGVSTWQGAAARRAERAAQAQARAYRDTIASVLAPLNSALGSIPETTEARAAIMRDVASFLEALAEAAGADPELLLEAAANYRELGRLQGAPRGASLGDLDAALASQDVALALLDRAARLGADATIVDRGRAWAQGFRADVLRVQGRLDEAIAALQAAAAAFARASDGRASSDALEGVSSERFVAQLAREAGRPELAAAALARSRAFVAAMPAPRAEPAPETKWAARVLAELGRQEQEARDPAALDTLDRALDLARRMPASLAPTEIRYGMADVLRTRIELLFDAGRMDEADADAAALLDIVRATPPDDDHAAAVRSFLFHALSVRADVAAARGDLDRAIAYGREFVAEIVERSAARPASMYFVYMTRVARHRLLHALLAALEAAAPDDARGAAWLDEADATIAAIDRALAALGDAPTAPSPTLARDLAAVLDALRARLDAARAARGG